MSEIKVITEDGHHLCWSCKEEIGDGPFCKNCVKIQPVSELGDYYSLFDLTPRYAIDVAALKPRFYELSRKFHPDYYSGHTDEEKLVARDNTAYLNDALKTLSDPIKRADYLLTLKLGNVKSEPAPPQDLFEEILEIGELLTDDESPDAARRRTLKENLDNFRARQQEMLDELDGLFEAITPDDKSSHKAVESRLNNIKYLRTIISRIERKLQEAA